MVNRVWDWGGGWGCQAARRFSAEKLGPWDVARKATSVAPWQASSSPGDWGRVSRLQLVEASNGSVLSLQRCFLSSYMAFYLFLKMYCQYLQLRTKKFLPHI